LTSACMSGLTFVSRGSPPIGSSGSLTGLGLTGCPGSYASVGCTLPQLEGDGALPCSSSS